MENERSSIDRATSSSSLKSGRFDNSLCRRENERPESPRVWGRNNRKMDEVEGGGNDPPRMRENERPESPGGWRTSNRKTDKAEGEGDEGEWKNVTRKR